MKSRIAFALRIAIVLSLSSAAGISLARLMPRGNAQDLNQDAVPPSIRSADQFGGDIATWRAKIDLIRTNFAGPGQLEVRFAYVVNKTQPIDPAYQYTVYARVVDSEGTQVDLSPVFRGTEGDTGRAWHWASYQAALPAGEYLVHLFQLRDGFPVPDFANGATEHGVMVDVGQKFTVQ